MIESDGSRVQAMVRSTGQSVVLIVALASFGCDAVAIGDPVDSGASTDGGSEKMSTLQFEVIKKGKNAFGYEKPAELLIGDEQEWARVWKTVESGTIPTPPVPAMDFATTRLIAVFAGDKPTGGFDVRIDQITKGSDGKTLQVIVKEKVPAEGAMVTQAFTSPYEIVKIEAGDYTINVERQKE